MWPIILKPRMRNSGRLKRSRSSQPHTRTTKQKYTVLHERCEFNAHGITHSAEIHGADYKASHINEKPIPARKIHIFIHVFHVTGYTQLLCQITHLCSSPTLRFFSMYHTCLIYAPPLLDKKLSNIFLLVFLQLHVVYLFNMIHYLYTAQVRP
jgi:hypothetical protein